LKPRLLTERDIKEEKGKHHPYVAFRRRVEKMTTRKNRKNDEQAYLSMLKLRSNFEAVVKLTSLIKLRETTKASWLECALSIFQARYAACPPLGGNRRASLSELCVLSAFLFYARPDVNRSLMMKHQLRRHRPTHLSHCRLITIDILIIMLVPI
jgi:hypothetical protein